MTKEELNKCFMLICAHSDNHSTDYILDICVEILSAFSHANFSFTQNFTAWNRMWVHGNLDLLPLWVTVSAMVSASCSRSYGYARLSWVAWWVERGTSASSGIWISWSSWLALCLSMPVLSLLQWLLWWLSVAAFTSAVGCWVKLQRYLFCYCIFCISSRLITNCLTGNAHKHLRRLVCILVF